MRFVCFFTGGSNGSTNRKKKLRKSSVPSGTKGKNLREDMEVSGTLV
jgi:hypothetical protein